MVPMVTASDIGKTTGKTTEKMSVEHPRIVARMSTDAQKKAQVLKAHRQFNNLGDYFTYLVEQDYRKFEDEITQKQIQETQNNE